MALWKIGEKTQDRDCGSDFGTIALELPHSQYLAGQVGICIEGILKSIPHRAVGRERELVFV